MDHIQRLKSIMFPEEELDCIHALILEGIIKPDSFQYFNDDVLKDVLLRYLTKCK